ncbi:MAG: hypothetical protein KZQ83_14565 [gamma proteobacterium symbiont of Taylorina sp.]|nr:hypothetical protein [gamma proteobacterium symbiont of Taylorina sp.]
MKIIVSSIILITTLITGCTYYQASPGAYYTTVPQNKFDQSWSAVTGALSDQGVHITTQDRTAGIIQGRKNATEVTASVRSQADGSVRIQFDTSGSTQHDSTLIERINNSYNRRMGR